MRKQTVLRSAFAVALLLMSTLTLRESSWAQSSDTPIIILDGSLTIQSAVPWSDFSGTGDIRTHPHTTKSVTKVVVTKPGTNMTETFSGEPCTVDVTYASAHIVFSTGSDGKGLTMRPFSLFRAGNTKNLLVHKTTKSKISHITVTKGSTTVFDSDASGGTQITISYQ